MEFYATAFASVGRLDQLEAFASLNGPAFYGLPANTRRLTLVAQPQEVPETLSVGGDELVPLAAGETLGWRVEAEGAAA